jgi:hypothetical protein
MILAVTVDGLLVYSERRITPWARRSGVSATG